MQADAATYERAIHSLARQNHELIVENHELKAEREGLQTEVGALKADVERLVRQQIALCQEHEQRILEIKREIHRVYPN